MKFDHSLCDELRKVEDTGQSFQFTDRSPLGLGHFHDLIYLVIHLIYPLIPWNFESSIQQCVHVCRIEEEWRETDYVFQWQLVCEVLHEHFMQFLFILSVGVKETDKNVRRPIDHEENIESQEDLQLVFLEPRVITNEDGRDEDIDDEHEGDEVVPVHETSTVGFDDQLCR